MFEDGNYDLKLKNICQPTNTKDLSSNGTLVRWRPLGAGCARGR